MFDAFMDFIDGALTVFSKDILMYIAVGVAAACFVFGLFAVCLSFVRREKRRYKAYNKFIKEKGLKNRENFDSLNVLICKKRTQITAYWELCYPSNTCVLVYNTPNRPAFAGRVRRAVCFTLGFFAASYLFLALQSYIVPVVMLLAVVLIESVFSCCDICACRRLISEQRKFQISISKAFTEVFDVRTCVCCCNCVPTKTKEIEEPVELIKKAEEKATLEPAETEKKIQQTKKTPQKQTPAKAKPKQEKRETPEAQEKPKVIAENNQLQKLKAHAKEPQKRVSQPRKQVATKVKSEPLPNVKPVAEQILETKPAAAPKDEAKLEEMIKPAVKQSKPESKRPAPVSKRISSEVRPVRAAPAKIAVIDERPVEDKMAALSARLGSLRQTITETTVEQTVVESVTVKSGGEISTNERSSQTIAASNLREVSTDGKVIEQSGNALGIRRDRVLENGNVLDDNVSFSAAIIKPKEEKPREIKGGAGFYSAPRHIQGTAPKAPSLAAKKPAKYNEGEVQNALFGLMSAMNKQQNQHDTADRAESNF